MMTYLAIYLAFGIFFAATYGVEYGDKAAALAIGFLWPIAVLWLIVMFLFKVTK